MALQGILLGFIAFLLLAFSASQRGFLYCPFLDVLRGGFY